MIFQNYWNDLILKDLHSNNHFFEMIIFIYCLQTEKYFVRKFIQIFYVFGCSFTTWN